MKDGREEGRGGRREGGRGEDESGGRKEGRRVNRQWMESEGKE